MKPKSLARSAARAGYLATGLRRQLAIERSRRAALSEALRSSLRPARGNRLLLVVLRHHLGVHHSIAYALLRLAELTRALRGVAVTRGTGRRAVVVGVELRAVRSPVARWESELAAEGLRPEPALVPRGDVDLDPGSMPSAGQLYRGADGVHRVAPDPEDALVVASGTHNATGERRHRRRRFVRYLEELRAYLAAARIPRRDRNILEAYAQGSSSRQIARRLDVHSSGIRALIDRHNKAAGIAGPGPGRG